MGRKGGRHTAKTGDVALYKSHGSSSSGANKKQQHDDDDFMYNEVDQYHNRREQEEFLKFQQDKDDNDDESLQDEAVLDLGLDVQDDDDDSSSSSSSTSEDESNEQEAAIESSSSDDDDEDMEEQEDVLDWGTSKSQYYHGDTADLELGQDEDDAFVEEEAAQEVLQKRYEDMDEGDFLMEDSKGEEEKKEKEEIQLASTLQKRKDKMTKREQRKFLESHHVEVLPLVQHFKKVVQNYDDKTRVVTSTLLKADKETIEEIGTTSMGLQYLVSKSACQASTALNVAMYLLLKAEQAENENDDTASATFSHPILTRLQQYNALLEKCNSKVEETQETGGLKEQLEKLLEATELMQAQDVEEESKDGEDSKEVNNDLVDQPTLTSSEASDSEEEQLAGADDDMEQDEEEDRDAIAQGVLNDARFGLRPQELTATGDDKKQKTKRKRISWSHFGPSSDGNEDENAKRASKTLASTMNAIEQRSQTRKRRVAPAAQEEEEDIQDDNLGRGLAMMDAEGLFDSDGEEKDGGEDNDEDEMSDDGDDFYSQVKKHVKAKKDYKKDLYRVAPKYPGMDEEVEGERAIGRTILKNRGLVAHKSKLNRNPRVKKREQYRKALIRRKGTVREVRTNEGHKYGGEETGIKSKLSRSRKLGVN